MTNMVNMTNSEHAEQMINDARDRRFVVMLTGDECEAIRSFQHENRLASMSKAARVLIKSGLEKEMPAQAGT